MQLAFLRRSASQDAIACPQINIGSSFPAVIKAALDDRAGSYFFSPYANDIDFLLSAPSLHDRTGHL